MAPWQKPENALRRATELIEVGRKQDALDTLHDVIKNRKARLWTKVHEQIMHKHLELCVELRKPHLAKDGLFQYRNMCQQVNAKSLEDVILAFLELAEKKAEQARQESQGLVEDVEDLDQAESPEKLLLSVVTGEGAQERSDRTILSPWLRFLWESYRQCLELLRNNMQVEMLYHRVAKQAFHFCLKYQRKTEFRKLCDNLRSHLNQIQKANQTSHYALKLTNAETLALHQETRLIQLDIAIQMELWQEAFKSVEDVHQLMQLTKKQARSSALASYFDKLALIFWKADNDLYHAAVLMKLFNLTREMKKTASPEELAQLATRTLLAVLSVNSSGTPSDLSKHLEIEETQVENQRRLATLIMLPSPPTRQSLLKDVVRSSLHLVASPVAQKLHKMLETEFSPLNLAVDVEIQLKVLSEAEKPVDAKYIEALKEVTAYKILKQVSQIYSAVKFDFLSKIIPFFDRKTIERLVVTVGKRSQIQIRVHHRSESVEFGANESSTAEDFAVSVGAARSAPTTAMTGPAAFALQGPAIQTMPSEQIRHHLQQMYAALNDACAQVDASEWRRTAGEALRNQITIYGYHKQDQHAQLLSRKRQIEFYKETTEKIRFDQEEKQREQEKRSNEQKLREMEIRLMKEKTERLEHQKRREQEDLQKRMMQDRLNRMKDPKLRKIIEDLPEEELQNLDHDLILQKQISHLEREKREQINKLKLQEKKWDYLVRAMHIEEVTLREKEYEQWAVEDPESWEEYETERIEKSIEGHKLLVELVDRMKRIETDANDVIGKVRKSRMGDFQKRLSDWEQRLKDTRQKRLQERKNERKAKRREEWVQQNEAEKKRKEEEERQQDRRQGGRRPYDQQDPESGGAGGGAPESGNWQRGLGMSTEARFVQRRAPGVDGGGLPSDEQPPAPISTAPTSNWRENRPAAVPSPSSGHESPAAGAYRPPGMQPQQAPQGVWRQAPRPVTTGPSLTSGMDADDRSTAIGAPPPQASSATAPPAAWRRRTDGAQPPQLPIDDGRSHQAYRQPQDSATTGARHQEAYDQGPPQQQPYGGTRGGYPEDRHHGGHPDVAAAQNWRVGHAKPPSSDKPEPRDFGALRRPRETNPSADHQPPPPSGPIGNATSPREPYDSRPPYDNRERGSYENRGGTAYRGPSFGTRDGAERGSPYENRDRGPYENRGPPQSDAAAPPPGPWQRAVKPAATAGVVADQAANGQPHVGPPAANAWGKPPQNQQSWRKRET